VIGEIFRLILIEPMINLLVVLNNILFDSTGLAIIAFTILVRLAMFPLTLRQLHHTKALQQLQPRIQEINKKYSDPKRRQEEMMKVYREAGANPIGCLGPMLIQLPILFALFIAIRRTLPESPEALELLHNYLYDWSYIQNAVPLNDFFLGMDLKANGGESAAGWLMVILVGVTSWIQTKTTVVTSTDPRVQQQQQMMAIMMPLMFAWFALTFPNGVSLYWVVSSIIGIGQNILIYGLPRFGIQPVFNVRTPAPPPPAETPPAPARGKSAGTATPPTARELRTANGPGRNKRQNRRRRN
jgi:YidC/Oxa1 family membrane protein insertase